ncbi:MAG: cupin domain-containing protein [Candidatus Hydrogenedentes bacterium]|nr:cupin domain-containing protein [Candidatus Hydrogenedentota bacterium]
MNGPVFDSISINDFSNEKYQKVNLYESHRLFCDVYCLLPGQSQRPHVHNDEDKVYHGLTGTCDVQIGEVVQPLPPGHTAIAAAGVLHAITNNSDSPATVLAVMAPHPRLRTSS